MDVRESQFPFKERTGSVALDRGFRRSYKPTSFM